VGTQQQNKRTRMVKEAKALSKKAERSGTELRGRDKARLRLIAGRLSKSVYDQEDESPHGA
jgi:hypothetical protein